MKTANDIYFQGKRLFERHHRLMTSRAAAAHPETGGQWNLVHNWGNDAARAVIAKAEARWNRIRPIEDRLYAKAMLRDPFYVAHPDCPAANWLRKRAQVEA